MKKYPIVILHGWNLSASKFNPLKNELRDRGYDVICFDLPGFGALEKSNRPLTLDDYISFVEEVLSLKKISKIILIGHSFGGRVGIKLAFQNPELLYALILTGVPGISPVSPVRRLFFLFIAKAGRFFFSLPILSFFTDRARRLLYRLAKASDYYHTEERMKETFRNVVREDLILCMSQISVPALLLWGKKDRIVPVAIAVKISNILKNARLEIIPEARHSLPFTHPKLFVEEVEKFLKGLEQ